jgi:hypothetical protein
MKNIEASLITESGAVIFANDQQYTVTSDHPNYEAVLDALRAKDYSSISSLLDLRLAVREFVSPDPDFTLENDRITFDRRPFSEAVTAKVLAMIGAGNDASPLIRFLRNVRHNPSNVAQDELLLFCEANNFMITDDGYILAYKSVRGDYTDIHSGTIRNMVGDAPTMARNAVDDRRENTCSSGFHFASYNYASTWAGECDGVHRKLMVMKVHPKNVVSIPHDYENQKGRCWTYEVVGEVKAATPLPPKEVYSHDDLIHACEFCGAAWDTDADEQNFDEE